MSEVPLYSRETWEKLNRNPLTAADKVFERIVGQDPASLDKKVILEP